MKFELSAYVQYNMYKNSHQKDISHTTQLCIFLSVCVSYSTEQSKESSLTSNSRRRSTQTTWGSKGGYI